MVSAVRVGQEVPLGLCWLGGGELPRDGDGRDGSRSRVSDRVWRSKMAQGKGEAQYGPPWVPCTAGPRGGLRGLDCRYLLLGTPAPLWTL